MKPPFLPTLLIPRLPFFYGWVVLGCVCLAGFARQGPAVAVLSVFVVPSTAKHRTSRAPRRSSTGPISGEINAASTPPSETAPPISVRDQPNSVVIGTTKTDRTATAGP